MIVPFVMAVGTGGNKSAQFSSEISRNVYFGYSQTNKRSGAHDFPGLKLEVAGTGIDRGDHIMAGVRYVINGTTLYKEDSGHSRTTLSSSVTGTERAIFADDGTNLYFVTEGTIYRWSGSALSTISQSAVTNPSSIAYLNSRFIITGNNGYFACSDVGDGTTYQVTNVAQEETNPDGLTRVYVFNQLAYMLGEITTVPWRNNESASTPPPYDRLETGLVNVGIAGKFAVTNTNKYLYWLTDDKQVVQCIGASFRPVNTSEVSYIIEDMSTTSDCIMSSFTFQGQEFVMLKFPTANTTLLFSETLNYWVELDGGTDRNSRTEWYGNSVSTCYGKLLATDYRNGNTYSLDKDTYTDNSDTRLRIIITPTFSGKDIAMPGRQITASRLHINMQTGVGLATGQGSAPVLMAEFSQEGGEIWKGERNVDIGVMGDYVKTVDLWDFATGYEIKARIMISDPVFFSAFDGFIELDDAGF